MYRISWFSINYLAHFPGPFVPDLLFYYFTQEGREVAKKKAFVPPPRFMNVDEAR